MYIYTYTNTDDMSDDSCEEEDEEDPSEQDKEYLSLIELKRNELAAATAEKTDDNDNGNDNGVREDVSSGKAAAEESGPRARAVSDASQDSVAILQHPFLVAPTVRCEVTVFFLR